MPILHAINPIDPQVGGRGFVYIRRRDAGDVTVTWPANGDHYYLHTHRRVRLKSNIFF
jgi:hypothetical protein